MKQTFLHFLTLIDQPNMGACYRLCNDHFKRFEQSLGSLTKHQAWPGGYIDHITEGMNFGFNLYEMMSKYERPLDFTLSDFLLVFFLHDLEKPFRYVEPKLILDTDEQKNAFIDSIIEKYGFNLTNDHRNALKYIHGEGDDYHRTERIQKPLAAFAHICDVASARIWFDYPKNN